MIFDPGKCLLLQEMNNNNFASGARYLIGRMSAAVGEHNNDLSVRETAGDIVPGSMRDEKYERLTAASF